LQGARSYWPLAKPTRLNQLLRDRQPVRPEPEEYMTDQLAREAVKYIESTKDKPLFMYLAFNATHGPNHATEADLAQTGGNRIAAMTIALDRAVGTVLDGLEANGKSNDTLVVFVNDNGGAQGHDNLPLRGQKGSCWEGGYRVPFAMRYPGVIPDGRVLEAPVIALDIFPTMLAAAGIEMSPGQPLANKLDGANLLPYASGESDSAPHEVLYWKNGDRWAIRAGNLKLCVPEGKGEQPMLFDLVSDVSEQKDLAAERPDDVARLQKLYDEWKATHEPTSWGSSGWRRGRG
jgi:arylsulfatase A-like enzyme